MAINRVLFRFLLIYCVLLLGVGFVLQSLGIKSNSGAGAGVFVVSLCWVCYSFANNNKRYFTGSEKKIVVFGMVLIALIFQGLVGYMLIPGPELPLMWNKYFFILFVFIAALHTIGAYWFVGFVGKMLAKQG